jgi:hypothetical protein
MRRISIYFLIIFCTIIKAQDDLVLVKLQNGKNVKGIIVQGGGPGDHYVRIKKRNQKTVDIYMEEVEHIYKGTGSVTLQITDNKGIPIDPAVIIVEDLDSWPTESVELQDTSYDDFPIGNYKITVQKEGYNSNWKRIEVKLGKKHSLEFKLTPPVETRIEPVVETRIEPAKKQVEVTDNTSGKYNTPSKTLKKFTAVSSLILGFSGAYFEYSASKNYDNYKNSKTDAASYRENVEQADDMKLKLFISSGVLMGATAYLHIKGKKVENIQHDQPVN